MWIHTGYSKVWLEVFQHQAVRWDLAKSIYIYILSHVVLDAVQRSWTWQQLCGHTASCHVLGQLATSWFRSIGFPRQQRGKNETYPSFELDMFVPLKIESRNTLELPSRFAIIISGQTMAALPQEQGQLWHYTLAALKILNSTSWGGKSNQVLPASISKAAQIMTLCLNNWPCQSQKYQDCL